ncbi:MAG: hypothetical protein WCD69_22345 [Xanthobacteraceae bacterium]
MTTASDVLRKLAEDDGNYIALDLSGSSRLVMKDGNGREICTVPQAHFDSLRAEWFLDRVDRKWRLNESGKKAAAR